MNGITAAYTTNINATWRQVRTVAKEDGTAAVRTARAPGAVHLPSDRVTISDEARAMFAAASRWAAAQEETGRNPAAVAARPPGELEAGSSGRGGRAGAGGGTRGATGSDDNADAIADLKNKIRKLQDEIAELMIKPWDNGENRRLVMSKRLELMTLQDQLARLESENITVII